MATYTPLKAGQAPSFGTSGDAVKAFQMELNKKNANVAGYVPLKVDGMYGAKTQAAAGLGSTNLSVNNVTDPASANSYINNSQQKDFDIASSKNGDTPPIKASTKSYEDMFNELKSTITGGLGKKPEGSDFLGEYKKQRESSGITDLETELNDAKARAKVIKDANRARKAAEEGKVGVAMNVIQGRQSEEDRQDQLKLDVINEEIDRISNQLDTKYKAIDTLMTYGKYDYDNAVDTYDKQFTQNLNLYNVVKGIKDDEKNDLEREEDNARANLQIIYNNIAGGGVDLKSVSPDQKANITKLELKAGLPVGFYQSLQAKNPKSDILSTTTRDSGGTKYADVIMKNADGSLSVKSISLGATSSGSGGDLSLGEKKNLGFSNINSILESGATTKDGSPVTDANGFITPAGLKQIIKYGSTVDISRKEILEQYGDQLYKGDAEDYTGYGLLPAEVSRLISP